MDALRIHVFVDSYDGETTVADYVFDLNDDQQRRTFAEQVRNAYLAGQMVTTYAEDRKPGFLKEDDDDPPMIF